MAYTGQNILYLNISHKHNSNSLAAVLHINKVMRPATAKGCTPLA